MKINGILKKKKTEKKLIEKVITIKVVIWDLSL